METIAIIAHDGKKPDMLAFASRNRNRLRRFHLLATESTGKQLRDGLGLDVELALPGPMGGDAQIAARVVTGQIHAVFFFVDPLDKHPHEPDIQALLRACNTHNVPLATNVATAELIITAHTV